MSPREAYRQVMLERFGPVAATVREAYMPAMPMPSDGPQVKAWRWRVRSLATVRARRITP